MKRNQWSQEKKNRGRGRENKASKNLLDSKLRPAREQLVGGGFPQLKIKG